MHEICHLVDQGVVEITFIGQTINSYHYKAGEKTTRLADLLYQASEMEGLKRVYFVTNYPTGMSDELLAAVRDLPKVSKHLHIPAQSGSDSVLKRMKRQYTSSEYRELVDRIYSTIPVAAITSDFIVGFCGETDDEFRATADLVRYGRFKNSFIFKYSERPGTKAAERFSDDVPEETKKWRNQELLEIQNAISHEANCGFIGREVEILVEGITKKCLSGGVQLSGRTLCDRIVVFDADNGDSMGTFRKLKIYDAAPFTLFGKQC